MASIEQFVSNLNIEGKHGCYQLLPPKLIETYPTLSTLPYDNIRLDDKRFDYFTSKLNLNGVKVTDIGANIGYFTFRLITEKLCDLTIYEPFKPHAQIISDIAELLHLSETSLTHHAKGVSLDNVDDIEKSDVILLFNVLQHAGEDFDSEYVKSSADWYAYALDYLRKLNKKSKHLVFQNGYSWLGHKDDLCAKNEIIPFTKMLLEDAGWEVLNCGVVSDFNRPVYKDVDLSSDKHPALGFMKYLEYGIKSRLGMNLPNYRFIERPIFICKSHG